MPPRNGQQPAQKPVQSRAQGRKETVQPLNCEQKRILQWLRKVRFRKQLFGGISERDAWKKIEELNAMYNNALMARTGALRRTVGTAALGVWLWLWLSAVRPGAGV